MEFEVFDTMAYLSHLELMKVFRQAFRRSFLEVKFSEGFNPHMKLSFCVAKSVGLESRGELLEIEVNEEIDEIEFLDRINEVLPKGIKVTVIKKRDETKKSLSALLKKARYFLYGNDSSIDSALDKLDVDKIVVSVKTKRKEEDRDLKDYIISIDREDGGFYITVFAGSEKNLRIDYLLKYLDEDILVRREKLLGEDKEIINMF